jgi:hypothetical protein
MKQTSRFMFGLLGLLIAGSPAAQTNYPEKPIRMVVPVRQSAGHGRTPARAKIRRGLGKAGVDR